MYRGKSIETVVGSHPIDRYRLVASLLPALEVKGFQTTPDRYVRLYSLLEVLPSDAAARDICDYLCPIFATTEQQQQHFRTIFTQTLHAITFTETATKPKENKIDMKNPSGDTSSNQSNNKTLEERPKTNPPTPVNENNRKPLSIDLDNCTEPPYYWNVAPESDIQLVTANNHNRVVTRLRSRETTEIRTIDWRETVNSSARNAGTPSVVYRFLTRPVEYLLLVERYSRDDHRAILFDRLWTMLRQQEVRIERFFHDGDLRICSNEQFPNGIRLRELQHRYYSSRLIVLGNGYRMLSPVTGGLAAWSRSLNEWQFRVLLTPVSRHKWGHREQELTKLFSLFPVAWESLSHLSEIAASSLASDYYELPQEIRSISEQPPVKIESPVIPHLGGLFEPDLCRLVAICAIWPSLNFNLTLELANLISKNLLTVENLTRLSSIDWFVNGHIPREYREELISFLESREPVLLKRAYQHILEILENNPPENNRSVAYANYQLSIAMLGMMSSENVGLDHISDLKTVLKRLDRLPNKVDFVLSENLQNLFEELKSEEGYGAKENIEQKPETRSFKAGQKICGRYLLLNKISKGELATLWHAKNTENQEEVALKIYNTSGITNEKLAQQEIIVSSGKRYHPNIIKVLDWGVDADIPFVTYPYYSDNASNFVGKTRMNYIVRLIRDVGAALSFWHNLDPSISHNNIRPQNIFIDRDGKFILGNPGYAISWADKPEENFLKPDEMLDVVRKLKSKDAILSPEVKNSRLNDFTCQSDIWMFGYTLYEIVTGVKWKPNYDDNGVAILDSTLFQNYPNRIELLIKMCLHQWASERPLAEDLFQSLNGPFRIVRKRKEKPYNVFIVYSHKDADYLEELRGHLQPMERAGLLNVWCDREIEAGENWVEAIRRNIYTADMILLMLSPAYYNTSYVHDKILKYALMRYEKGEATLIPVVVRPCDYMVDPIVKTLQVLPKDARPVSLWENRDEAWIDVVEGLRQLRHQHLSLGFFTKIEGKSEDDLAWEEAIQGNKIESYKLYLQLFPNGFHHQEALAVLDNIEKKLDEKKGNITNYPFIYISYREADTLVEAQLIYSFLVNKFGDNAIFMNKNPVGSSKIWPIQLEKKASDSRVILALIKDWTKWVGILDDLSWLLDNPNDIVRRELEKGLERKVLLPVFINGAAFPALEKIDSLKLLATIQGYKLTTDENFDESLQNLGVFIEKIVTTPTKFKINKSVTVGVLKLTDDRIKDTYEMIENIEFESAFYEFNKIKFHPSQSNKMWPIGYELAYIYLHAGKIKEGVILFEETMKYLKSIGLVLNNLKDTPKVDNTNTTSMLDYLRQSKPEYYLKMERRYFPNMIFIKGGTFEMGDVMGDGITDRELPVHSVTLSDYELADTPQTWWQYGLYCFATGLDLPSDAGFGRANRPVINVSWDDAFKYAEWLSANSSKKFRLPTEAEWEFAARERGRKVRFGNGKDIADAGEMNYDASREDEYSVNGERRGRTTPVDGFLPNALGLHDMSGNIWEWCGDWYGDYAKADKPVLNPSGPEEGVFRVDRGGSWGNYAGRCRASYRGTYEPGDRDSLLGFRLAASAPK